MTDKGSKFYYSRLTDGEKHLYEKISGALLRFEPALSLHAGLGKAFLVDTKKILTAVLFDNPVFFYVDRRRMIVKQTPMYIQLHFRYTYEKEEATRLWDEVEQRVDSFIKERITPTMSPLAKQIQLHRFLTSITAAKEPFVPEHFSVVGALVDGCCVCEGYAKAYKLLCDRLGIASLVVLGEAVRPDGKKESHAWNITRINGVTAHTDACWDAQFGLSSYDYFNLCDADMAADHYFDHTVYPGCDPNIINYFYKNGLIAGDEEELRRMMAEKAEQPHYSIKLLFPFSAEQVRRLPFNGGEVRYNAAQNIISHRRSG